MAASQNARSGSTPKIHRRSRPPIQTCDPDRSRPHDPDRSRPHDPDLWSRPLCFMLFGNFLFQSTEKYYPVLQSTTPVILCTAKYYSVLQSTMLVSFGKIWPSRSTPRSRPFQTSSMESKNNQCPFTAMLPRRQNRSVRPVQKHLIQFKSYMKWLWFQALRSRRAEKTFYENGRSRRPDYRGTIQTRLSTHNYITMDGLQPTHIKSHWKFWHLIDWFKLKSNGNLKVLLDPTNIPTMSNS